MHKFRKGQRVVPTNKTIGIDFKKCFNWKTAQRQGQNFLYVISHNNKGWYELHIKKDHKKYDDDTSFYRESDLISYKEWLKSHTPDGSSIAMTDYEIEQVVKEEIKSELNHTVIEMAEWMDSAINTILNEDINEDVFVENGCKLVNKIERWKGQLK